MKKVLCILIVSLFACSVKLSAQIEHFKPEVDMIQLTELNGKINLKVGQKAYFKKVEHSSVGLDVGLDLKDKAMVKIVDTHLAYHHSKSSNGIGKDKVTKTYIIEAVNPGKTKIKVQEMFKGEVHEEDILTLVITN